VQGLNVLRGRRILVHGGEIVVVRKDAIGDGWGYDTVQSANLPVLLAFKLQ